MATKRISPSLNNLMLAGITEASYTAEQRRKATSVEAAFKPGYLYIGWAQKFAQQKNATARSPRFAGMWEISPDGEIQTLIYVTRSKLSGFYVEDSDVIKDDKGGLYAPGIMTEVEVEKGTFVFAARTANAQHTVFEGCAARISGSEQGEAIDQDGPIFILEPFAFKCKEAAIHYKTMMYKHDGVWDFMHYDVNDRLCKIFLSKKHVLMFEAPTESVEELVTKYDLYIPEGLKALALETNPKWFPYEQK